MIRDGGTSEVKQCCAATYGGRAARWLLGESFHPGGVALTLEVAQSLNLTHASHLLDVAAGRGTSAFAVAERFGCSVTGIDLSDANVEEANGESRRRGLADRVRFVNSDAERIAFADGSFDALLCECAFCTFPDKRTAASEFARVLRSGGSAGISDLTRAAESLPELDGLLAWVACIGDARPAREYAEFLEAAGFTVTSMTQRDDCLIEMVERVRSRVLLADVMRGLNRFEIPEFDLGGAKALAATAARAVRSGILGYAVVVCDKPGA